MEAKHTPGPWETKREYSHGPIIIMGGDGKPVVVCREKRDPEEYEANVLLMSAAPELLQALIIARDIVIETIEAIGPCDHSVNICCCGYRSDLEDINAAIAKATGVK